MKIDLVEIAEAAGADAAPLPRKQGWALLQAWREIYCAPVQEATGKWCPGGGPAWHCFSAGYFPAIKGRRALADYAAQSSTDLLVLPDDDHLPSIRCSTPAALDFSGLCIDVYVAPRSYEWTMVFTHEAPDFGPYFSRAAWRLLPR